MAARQDVWFGRSCDLIDQLMATLHNAQFHPPLAAGSEHDHSPETTALHINALVADIDGCGSNIGDIIVKMVMWLTAARTWRPAGHSDQSAMLAVRRTVRYQLVEWNDIFSVVRACWTLSVPWCHMAVEMLQSPSADTQKLALVTLCLSFWRSSTPTHNREVVLHSGSLLAAVCAQVQARLDQRDFPSVERGLLCANAICRTAGNRQVAMALKCAGFQRIIEETGSAAADDCNAGLLDTTFMAAESLAMADSVPAVAPAPGVAACLLLIAAAIPMVNFIGLIPCSVGGAAYMARWYHTKKASAMLPQV